MDWLFISLLLRNIYRHQQTCLSCLLQQLIFHLPSVSFPSRTSARHVLLVTTRCVEFWCGSLQWSPSPISVEWLQTDTSLLWLHLNMLDSWWLQTVFYSLLEALGDCPFYCIYHQICTCTSPAQAKTLNFFFKSSTVFCNLRYYLACFCYVPQGEFWSYRESIIDKQRLSMRNYGIINQISEKTERSFLQRSSHSGSWTFHSVLHDGCRGFNLLLFWRLRTYCRISLC